MAASNGNAKDCFNSPQKPIASEAGKSRHFGEGRWSFQFTSEANSL